MFKLLVTLFLSLISIAPMAFSAQNLSGEVELIPKDIKTGGIGRYTIGSDRRLHFSFLLCYNRKNCPDVIFKNDYIQQYPDKMLFLYSEDDTFEKSFSVLEERERKCFAFSDCYPSLGIHSYTLDSDNFKNFLKLRSKDLEENKELKGCGCNQKVFLSLKYDPSKAKSIFIGKYEYVNEKFYLVVEVGVNVKPSMIEIHPSELDCNLNGSFFLSKYFVLHSNDSITGDEKSIPPINICNSNYESDGNDVVNFSHTEGRNFVGDKFGKMHPKEFTIDQKSCDDKTLKRVSLLDHPELVKNAFIGNFLLKDNEVHFIVSRSWKGEINRYEIVKRNVDVNQKDVYQSGGYAISSNRLSSVFSHFNKSNHNRFGFLKSYFSSFNKPIFNVFDVVIKNGVHTPSYLFLSTEENEVFDNHSRSDYPLNFCTTEMTALDSVRGKMGIYSFKGDINPSWQYCENDNQCTKTKNKCGTLKTGINRKYVTDYLKYLKKVKSLIGHYEAINLCRSEQAAPTEKIPESKCVENFCS